MPMKRELKTKLATINRWLQEPCGEALWDVLTALRGPDSNSLADKCATTAVIRRHALPSAADLGCAYTQEDNSYGVSARKEMGCGHFGQHARHAFDALGLAWGTENPLSTRKKARK